MNAIALVIGNANYINENHRLINAVNDATDIASKLSNLGFIVKKAINCNNEQFEREVMDFGNELKKFDVGLFYFSGHGLQIDGLNYLTSIDTNFFDSISAKRTSFPLDDVINYMKQAKPKIKILILDACRNNPLPNDRSVQNNGLAPIHAPKGTIIAFSTSPGETAKDSGMGKNSIYTGSLLKHIDDINIPIEEFFKRVRTSVFTLSSGRQTSWEHTSLIGNFYFNSNDIVHSIELPYKSDCIADKNFQSTGSEIDEIIEELKSYNFYRQKPAIQKLSHIKPAKLDSSSLFLLGRNLLQTAIGGEFTAESIFNNLSNSLLRYFTGDENHVLNGILFEIYFNSKGRFRQRNFKNDLIEEIFNLQSNVKYKLSFDFILKQILPFKDYLYYLPTYPPKNLAIEVKFEESEYSLGTQKRLAYKIKSIKHEEVELFHEDEENGESSMHLFSFESFTSDLTRELCVPKNKLTLITNIETNIDHPLRIMTLGGLKLHR